MSRIEKRPAPRRRVRSLHDSLAAPTVYSPLGFSVNGEAVRPRFKIIYLAGKAPLGRAFGVNGFILERPPDESEDDFFVRSVQAAAAANLEWLAFTRPVDLGHQNRRDDVDAIEEFV